MADILWPATLPQAPATFSQARSGSSVLRTQPDDGPAKMRRRFTKSVKQGSMSFVLTLAQWNILEAFYETDLNEGTQFFVMNHPWYNAPRKFRITKPYNSSAEGSLAVNVSMDWELF
jgi:hypothetical protein